MTSSAKLRKSLEKSERTSDKIDLTRSLPTNKLPTRPPQKRRLLNSKPLQRRKLLNSEPPEKLTGAQNTRNRAKPMLSKQQS